MSTTNRPGDQTQTAAELQLEWDADPRWEGVKRDYTAEDVIALRGPVREEREKISRNDFGSRSASSNSRRAPSSERSITLHGRNAKLSSAISQAS